MIFLLRILSLFYTELHSLYPPMIALSNYSEWLILTEEGLLDPTHTCRPTRLTVVRFCYQIFAYGKTQHDAYLNICVLE